ncbi:MAG: tyrosine 2,3-aminomutase [Candidatus Nanohaloarchaea archaeon]|nr:tyrosine 2,3-aminomutase [Candidatus Nanohaloarchaea archaeon]
MAETTVDGETLSLEDLVAVARDDDDVTVAEDAMAAVRESRAFVERQVEEGEVVYGVTTGFGEMVDRLIRPEKAEELQENLVRSHACNVGPRLPRDAVRGTMLVRANCLANGRSGVREETLRTLTAMLNNDVVPVVPSLGSVGASGDLNPLAHMALAVTGEGTVDAGGETVAAAEALERNGIDPVDLGTKEGLALINGTSAMTAVTGLAAHDCRNLLAACEISAAMTCEALEATTVPFEEDGNDAKNDPGQVETARRMRDLLAGSSLVQDHQELSERLAEDAGRDTVTDADTHLQQAYSLRATPQVLGPVRDTVNSVAAVVEDEMNAVTDNPLVFADGQHMFHGANFHGQRVAGAADDLARAACQIGIISDRRIERLLDTKLNGDLPPFLAGGDAGLRCGLEGSQYVATSLVAENRVLSNPASTQSIPSNGGNQDVVSMGLVAARQASTVVRNARYVVAVELLSAYQALHLKDADGDLGQGTAAAVELLSEYVDPVEEDRPLTDDLETIASLIEDGTLPRRVADALQ